MGTMRLVVDAREQAAPVEVEVHRLQELLADRGNCLWLDLSDPDQADVDLLRRVFGFHETPPVRTLPSPWTSTAAALSL